MYLALPNYRKHIIKDLYTVWLPPVPDRKLIQGWELKKADQFWRRTPLPAFYTERRQEEMERQKEELILVQEGAIPKLLHYDETLERYRRQEWLRRIHGHWFMNNGVPTYITGAHYMYLQWSKLDHQENDGYPLFYMPQLDRFYFRQLCWEDPFCLGYLIVGPRGFGKCLGLGTVVRMYDGGVKKVEDVVVGDLLLGPDSEPRKVLKLHRGEDDMFEIVQNQAMSYVVNSQHVISLKRNAGASFTERVKKGKKKKQYPSKGNIVNIPLYDLIGSSKTFFNTFSGYKVAVNYSEKKIDIDPYFLGVWLGDGNSDAPIITNMDEQVIQSLYEYADRLGLYLKKRENKGSKAKIYSFTSTEYRASKNKLLDMLRHNNLIDNKHIPFNYLYNTKEIRLQVLAGIIDTDGYYFGGVYEIVQVRKKLAIDIKMLADTLGFKTSIKARKIKGVTYWRVFISGHNGVIPVKINRKKSITNPNKDHTLTKINEINYLGKGQYFGFELDGDRLFLLEDGTVTHNTSEEAAMQVEHLTRPPHKRHAAIQSKTEADAVDVVFKEKMVPIFNEYPDFFKPEYNHGSDPAKRMVFKRKTTNKNDKSNLAFGEDYELGNTIKCYSAKEKAVDGKTLADIISDEIGKTHPNEEADVYERHGIHIKCVFRNMQKRGIIRATTTVEEMDKGGAECFEIWSESNPVNRDPNGYTASKIYKYLVTGMECQVDIADAYGNIPHQEAEQKIDNERQPFLDDPYKLSIVMRKNPKNENEAFIRDQTKSLFNVFILNKRITQLEAMVKKGKKLGRRGRLEWVKEPDGEVEFIEDSTGMFVEYYTMDRLWNNSRPFLNACSYYSEDDPRTGKEKKIWLPANNDLMRAGADPIRFVKSDDPRASKFSAFGYLQYVADLDNGKEDAADWVSDCEVWNYFGRSEDPTDDFENIIKALRYWGQSIMPENNVTDFVKHLYGRGYHKFIIIRRNFDPSVLMQKGGSKNSLGQDQAVASTTESQDAFINKVRRWVVKKAMRSYNLELLRQLIGFIPDKITQFDQVVGWGYTLLALEANLDDPSFEQNQDVIRNYFKTYDISGARSVRVDQSSGEDDDPEDQEYDDNFFQDLFNRSNQ